VQFTLELPFEETKMKTIHWFFSASLSAALGGCVAGAAPDAIQEEDIGVARQADTADYSQNFDENAQSIVFQPSSAIDWVILHLTIDGTRSTNVGMPATGSSYSIGSLPIVGGDNLSYSFTYSVNGLATDTPAFSYTLPARWEPTAFFTEVAGTSAGPEIAVVSTEELQWADVHYTVNGGVQLNLRLGQQGSNLVQPVALNPGDVLGYSVTYSTGAAVFDTGMTEYVASSKGDRFVVDLGTDSTTGLCAANARSHGRCNLRAALAAAQGATGPVTIKLTSDSTVTEGQMSVVPPSSGASSILIETGPDHGAHAITGTANGRLLEVASTATLELRNLSIANFTAEDSGAAILNDGTVDLEGVTLSSNTVRCVGVGALTAFATCSGGAVANTGTMTIGGGTAFSNNTVTADASTASYTTAWAGGGAILSSGTLSIVGPVSFIGNSAVAEATSGYHEAPIGGATATASGGAIDNSGTVSIAGAAGSCQFQQNSASASGSTIYGTTTTSSAGGAIENTGTLQIAPGVCVFSDDSAQTNPDIDG
jgi:hypothetical protein